LDKKRKNNPYVVGLEGGARTSPLQPPRRTHLLSGSRQPPPHRTHILSGSLPPPPRRTHILSRVPAAAAAPHANLSRAPAAAASISLPASTPLVACKAAGLDAARRPSKIRMRQGTWPKGTCWPRSGSSGKAPGYPPHPSMSLASPPDTAPVSILLAQLVFILVLSSFCYCSAHP
jgi:hypothetical protein